MIRVAMIARSTLFSIRGGDTVQVTQTARHLLACGAEVDVLLTDEPIDYSRYQLLHFFNIIRPADILYHIKRSGKPFVVSTILVEYDGYDKFYRTGVAGLLFRFLSGDTIEYIKTVARWLLGRDRLMSKTYLWQGQKASMQKVMRKASSLLPNSVLEQQRLINKYLCKIDQWVVPNGIDQLLFRQEKEIQKDPLLVICVARIEGIKNQLNLIKAVNGTKYRLLIIGSPAPNQLSYYDACRKLAADNISFISEVPQPELLAYYQAAKTHVLPSWFETTGLSSLEAAAVGCNIVITDKGDAKEYFGSDAFYCDPASPVSIFDAIEQAAVSPCNELLQQQIETQYTWQKAAEMTMSAYKKITEPV